MFKNKAEVPWIESDGDTKKQGQFMAFMLKFRKFALKNRAKNIYSKIYLPADEILMLIYFHGNNQEVRRKLFFMSKMFKNCLQRYIVSVL